MSEDDQKEEKESFEIRSEEKGAKEVEDIIEEAEKELGVSSQSTVEESEERFDVNLTMIFVEVGKAFAKAVVDKYGDSFKDWLAGKLGLDKDRGEEVTKSS
jgi:hypothetical protein